MSPSRRRHRLFVQIMAGFTALAFAAIVVTGCICLFLFQRFAVRRHLSELAAGARAIVRVAGERVPRAYLSELRELTNAGVVFVDARGTARLSGAESGAPLSAGDMAVLARLLETGGSSGVYGLDLLDGPAMLAGAPAGGEGGAVLLFRPLSTVRADASGFFLPLAAGAAFAALLSVAASWYSARLISRPIVHLESAAARVRASSCAFENVSGPLEVENLGGALRDLSGRLNRAIDSLACERGRLMQVLGGIGEGLVAMDAHGGIIHCNAAARELSGCEGQNPGDGLGEAGDLPELLRSVVERPEQRSTVWQLRDGRSVQATVYPIFDGAADGVSGAVALMRDVSESERLDQMRRDYIANISHELRTPLTGIRGMVEPLLDGVIDGEDEKQSSYRIIYQETVRLQKLIGDMLDMSRLQDGHVDIALEPMEIASMLRAARQRMAGHGAEKGVALETEAPGSGLWCMGDEDRVMQVLIILLDNALRFTSAGGTVTLFARPDGEWVAFGVCDTGCGIDPNDLPYIWERFYKADRSRNTRAGGTGLGLSIAKLAVELMNGRICVHSAPGRGTQFTVRLRALDTPEAL